MSANHSWKITLSDGTSITVTRRHRLLRRDGWTNLTGPGDRIGVPGNDAPASREAFYATVASVEDVDHDGWVYDFEVPEHHNYVAAGRLGRQHGADARAARLAAARAA